MKIIGSFIFYGIIVGLGFGLMRWAETGDELSPAVHVIVDSLAIALIIYSAGRVLSLALRFSSRSFGGLLLLGNLLVFPFIVQFMVIKYFDIHSTAAKIALFLLALGVSIVIHLAWNKRAFRKTTVIDITKREDESSNSDQREEDNSKERLA